MEREKEGMERGKEGLEREKEEVGVCCLLCGHINSALLFPMAMWLWCNVRWFRKSCGVTQLLAPNFKSQTKSRP